MFYSNRQSTLGNLIETITKQAWLYPPSPPNDFETNT